MIKLYVSIFHISFGQTLIDLFESLEINTKNTGGRGRVKLKHSVHKGKHHYKWTFRVE